MTDSEKLELLANYKEHYNSMKVNIQTASEELNAIYKQIEVAMAELNKLNNSLLKLKDETTELLLKQENAKGLLKKERLLLDERQKQFDIAEQKHFEEIRSYVKKVEDEKTLLNEITRQHEELRWSLFEMFDQAEPYQELLEYINELDEIVDEKKRQVDLLVSEYDLLKEQYLKYGEEALKELASIEEDIYIKQRSLDGFKANKEKLEEDLARKERDIMIVIGRLKKLSEEKFGIALKI